MLGKQFIRSMSKSATSYGRSRRCIVLNQILCLNNTILQSSGAISNCVLNVDRRWKHSQKKSRKEIEDDSDEEDEEDDEELLSNVPHDNKTKIVKTTSSSLRIDAIVKAGLGIARNKVDTAFYESRLRLNGRKVLKKSALVGVQDEIDLIRGPSPTNPEFQIVSRITILSISITEDAYKVKLIRDKSLLIEKYKDYE